MNSFVQCWYCRHASIHAAFLVDLFPVEDTRVNSLNNLFLDLDRKCCVTVTQLHAERTSRLLNMGT